MYRCGNRLIVYKHAAISLVRSEHHLPLIHICRAFDTALYTLDGTYGIEGFCCPVGFIQFAIPILTLSVIGTRSLQSRRRNFGAIFCNLQLLNFLRGSLIRSKIDQCVAEMSTTLSTSVRSQLQFSAREGGLIRTYRCALNWCDCPSHGAELARGDGDVCTEPHPVRFRGDSGASLELAWSTPSIEARLL